MCWVDPHWSGKEVAEGAGGEDGGVVCNAGFKVGNGAERLGNEVWVGSEDFNELLYKGGVVFCRITRVDGHPEELKMLSHLTHVHLADLVGSSVEAELECMLSMFRIFLMLEGISVEVVRHVPVVGIKRWSDVGMEVE